MVGSLSSVLDLHVEGPDRKRQEENSELPTGEPSENITGRQHRDLTIPYCLESNVLSQRQDVALSE